MSNLEKRKPLSAEHARLEDSSPDTPGNWKAIGPYVSERAWGTVREDYSADGQAWQYFPYEHARSRAYRWNEDGLAGLCDPAQRLCFALAFWNGRDPSSRNVSSVSVVQKEITAKTPKSTGGTPTQHRPARGFVGVTTIPTRSFPTRCFGRRTEGATRTSPNLS
jgi:hypothetical protein